MAIFEAQELPQEAGDLWAGTGDLLKVARALHPLESVIGFTRKNPRSKSRWDALAAVEQRELSEEAPHLLKFLARDSYMTINGYRSRPANGRALIWR